jgi:hypothetical protein
MSVQHGNHIIGTMQLPEAEPILVLDSDVLSEEPSVHGLMLYRELLDNPDGLGSGVAPGGTCAFYARITVYAGNTATSFLCDWSGQCALVCSRLTVEAVPYHTQGDVVSTPLVDATRFRHGAMLGFGGWHAARPMTYSGAWLTLSSLGADVAIPRFARRLIPRVGTLTTPDAAPLTESYEVDLLNCKLALSAFGSAAGSYSSVAPLTPERRLQGIDLSGVGAIRLFSANSGPTLVVTPVFELAL